MDVKTERQGIYRTEEGALVNKDIPSLQAYRAKKKQANKINEVEADLKSIKGEMAEIKTLLTRFLER